MGDFEEHRLTTTGWAMTDGGRKCLHEGFLDFIKRKIGRRTHGGEASYRCASSGMAVSSLCCVWLVFKGYDSSHEVAGLLILKIDYNTRCLSVAVTKSF